jgi:hypothetical protein
VLLVKVVGTRTPIITTITTLRATKRSTKKQKTNEKEEENNVMIIETEKTTPGIPETEEKPEEVTKEDNMVAVVVVAAAGRFKRMLLNDCLAAAAVVEEDETMMRMKGVVMIDLEEAVEEDEKVVEEGEEIMAEAEELEIRVGEEPLVGEVTACPEIVEVEMTTKMIKNICLSIVIVVIEDMEAEVVEEGPDQDLHQKDLTNDLDMMSITKEVTATIVTMMKDTDMGMDTMMGMAMEVVTIHNAAEVEEEAVMVAVEEEEVAVAEMRRSKKMPMKEDSKEWHLKEQVQMKPLLTQV